MEIYRGPTLIDRLKIQGKDIAAHLARAEQELDADEIRVIHASGKRDVYRRKLGKRGWTKVPIRKATKAKVRAQKLARRANR